MNEPTMTLTTKEAWGDIMSMFSGGLEAERATNPAEMGDAAATAALAPIKEANTPAQKADETESFAIYEDTCLLSKEAVAAVAAPKQQSPIADLEIREDTVVLPPIAATPRPAAFGANAAKTPAMHGRTPLAAMPMRTPLLPPRRRASPSRPRQARRPCLRPHQWLGKPQLTRTNLPCTRIPLSRYPAERTPRL